jgi:hypothetical protein
VLIHRGAIQAQLPVAEPCFLRVDRFTGRNSDGPRIDEARTVACHRTAGALACVTFDNGFAAVSRHVSKRHLLAAQLVH